MKIALKGENQIKKLSMKNMLKIGILAILVGIAMLGILVVTTSLVSASATCTKTTDNICVSCTHRDMVGYNYRDTAIPSAAFTHGYFSGRSDAINRLTGRNGWGYSSSCVKNPGGRDFTKAVDGGKNRYQTRVAEGWRHIQFSQGPEPNPIPGWCSNGYWDFHTTLPWHRRCYEDCIGSGFCNPGTGI